MSLKTSPSMPTMVVWTGWSHRPLYSILDFPGGETWKSNNQIQYIKYHQIPSGQLGYLATCLCCSSSCCVGCICGRGFLVICPVGLIDASLNSLYRAKITKSTTALIPQTSIAGLSYCESPSFLPSFCSGWFQPGGRHMDCCGLGAPDTGAARNRSRCPRPRNAAPARLRSTAAGPALGGK